MVVDIPVTLEAVVTVLSFAGAVAYQSAMLRSSLRVLTERMEKIDKELAKITDILIKQETHSIRLETLNTGIVSLTQRMDRHEMWHEDQLTRIVRTKKVVR